MQKELKDLLENEVLGEETKTALQEAFNKKLEEAKAEIDAKLQEDYARRYEHDHGVLVEAMDRLLTDTIKSELTEFAEDRKLLAAERVKLNKGIVEARREYNAKLREHTNLLQAFVLKQLKSEMVEFAQDKKSLDVQRQQMALELKEARNSYKRQLQERLTKLESFVLKQLTEELSEFHADKQALIEQRIKLVKMGKAKIAETQKAFVARASNLIEQTVTTGLRKEFSEFKNDIKAARENNFGRRIFEAFATEYMASYLSEGSEVKKLQTQLKESNDQISKIKSELDGKIKLVEDANTKAILAEDNAVRIQTMNDLLRPLGREKQAVMEELLKDIKTKNLKEAFGRYLPTVVAQETTAKARAIDNTSTTQTVSVKTGDRKNILAEAVQEDKNTSQAEIFELRKLAGLDN